MKDANDGLDEIIDPAIDQAEGLKRNHGRYTLEEAAAFISERTGEDAKGLRDKFIAAVKNGDLATYAPFSFVKKASGIVRDFFEHVYWNDLNEWLEKNEPRLNCKFPQPIAETNDAMARKHGEQADAPAPQQDRPASASNALQGFGPRITTTNAPPPLKPMGTRATVRMQPTVAVVPNWSEWSHMPKVEVWQACALSLNINPYWLIGRSSYQIEPGRGPCFSERSFPSAIAHNEFRLRQRLLIANLPDNEEWFDFYYPSAINISEVRLSEFATWAVSRMKWPDLPRDLVALARNQVDAPEQIDAPAPVSNAEPAKVGAGDTAIEDVQSEQETNVPPYLTTSDLVGCFGGYMGVDNPGKVLSEYPKWATRNAALVQKGKRGKPSKENRDISAWNPVQFALNLLDKRPLPQLDELGVLQQKHLDTVFGMKSLAKWKSIWIKSKPL